MTVERWIDERLFAVGHKPIRFIRIIYADTNKGAGVHWIVFKDCEIVKIKITSTYIFIYV